MSDLIGVDIDGTIANYAFMHDGQTHINHDLAEHLRGSRVALISNQGGLAFGLRGLVAKDGIKYPSPTDFYYRFVEIALRLQVQYNIRVESLWAAVHHRSANPTDIATVARFLRNRLGHYPCYVFTRAESRKPSPMMLNCAGVYCYYGDSPEDVIAAQKAGIPYVLEPRFDVR